MYYTYILENNKDNLYIGQTNKPSSRLLRHNTNQVKSTRNKGPWKMIFCKGFETRGESMDFEKYLKSLKSSVYIRRYIIGV